MGAAPQCFFGWQSPRRGQQSPSNGARITKYRRLSRRRAASSAEREPTTEENMGCCHSGGIESIAALAAADAPAGVVRAEVLQQYPFWFLLQIGCTKTRRNANSFRCAKRLSDAFECACGVYPTHIVGTHILIKPAVLYCEVDQHRTVALSPSEKSQYFQLSQNQMATLALQNKTLHSVERSALMKFIGLYVNGGISTDSMDMQSGVQEEKLFAELNDQAGSMVSCACQQLRRGTMSGSTNAIL